MLLALLGCRADNLPIGLRKAKDCNRKPGIHTVHPFSRLGYHSPAEYIAAQFQPTTYLLPAVLQQAGMPIERVIIATVALNAGGIVGGLLLGSIVDRRTPYVILTTAYAVAAVFVAAIGAIGSASVPLIMAAIFAAGFFVIGSQYCINPLAANYYPTMLRSTGVGWALGIGRIASIVDPVVEA